MIKTRILVVSLGVVSLSACMTDNIGSYDNNLNTYQGSYLYPEGYDNAGDVNQVSSKQTVVVPESYHVSALHGPTSPKDLDKTWIDSQNPQSYTIELADSDKPSQVASALSKAPKNEHMAEVKYQNQGKTYYKGLYGTYPSYDAAQQALKVLPDDVKQGAGVKAWENVQRSVSE